MAEPTSRGPLRAVVATALAIALLGLAFIVMGPQDNAQQDDPWRSFAPAGSQANATSITDYLVLAPGLQAEAQALLEHDTFVPLTQAQAQHFGSSYAERRAGIQGAQPGEAADGGQGTSPVALVPVLLRSLVSAGDQREGDSFHLTWSDGTIDAAHSAIRVGVPGTYRRAILAWLPALPSEAYASAMCVHIGGIGG